MKGCMGMGITNMCDMQLSKASSMYSKGSMSIARARERGRFEKVELVSFELLVALVDLRFSCVKRLTGRGVSFVSSIASCHC